MTEAEIVQSSWINLGRWMQPPLSGCFWTHWHEAGSVRKIFPDHNFSQILFLDGNTAVLRNDLDFVKASIATLYEQNALREFCDRIKKVAVLTEKSHLALLSSTLSKKQQVRELIHSYAEMVGVWTIVIIIAMEAEAFAKSKKLVDSDERLLGFMQPFLRTTWLEEQAQDVRRIAKIAFTKNMKNFSVQDVKGSKKLLSMANAHLRTFAWFGTHHWMGEGYNLEKLVADMNAAKKEISVKEKVPTAPRSKNRELWRLVALCTYWRTHCAEATAAVVYALRGQLTSVAQQQKMTYDDVVFFSSSEIISLLKSAKKATLPKNFLQRKKGYGCILEKGKERVVTGTELKRLISAAIQFEKTDGISEIRGAVASKAPTVTGSVRVILSPADFGRFQKGNILVAPETTPDFVPLMKIAAAIVTEVGGITSHAAIVSRELKKPCVIGTKIATKVLKDGDMIEVDSEKGIVKILN